jgi:tRNA(Ile)-lysidine synthase
LLAISPWPESAHAVVESQLLAARPDALPEYRWPGGLLRRWRDLLYLDQPRPSLPDDWCCEWDGRSALELPTGDKLDFVPPGPATMDGERFLVAARRGGERIQLPGRPHSHSLKHVLQVQGIPPWERARMPLLFAPDGELLAAGDAVLSARWLREEMERGRRVEWRRRPD